jgi:hypothetical protein
LHDSSNGQVTRHTTELTGPRANALELGPWQKA